MSQDSVYIVDYTEKAIAVFGDTKVMKDHLASLGGKFNPSLRGNNDDKKPGWIFPNTKRSEVQSLLDEQQVIVEQGTKLLEESTHTLQKQIDK